MDVSGTPVIHEHHAKDVFLGLRDWDRCTELVAWPNKVSLYIRGRRGREGERERGREKREKGEREGERGKGERGNNGTHTSKQLVYSPFPAQNLRVCTVQIQEVSRGLVVSVQTVCE